MTKTIADDRAAIATIIELERIHGLKIDAILPSGAHWYHSTHCRHGDHNACAATELVGHPIGDDCRVSPLTVEIDRKPAQCKHCGAPCRCTVCHGEGAS